MALRQLTRGNMNFAIGVVAGFAVSLLLTTFISISLTNQNVLHTAQVMDTPSQQRRLYQLQMSSLDLRDLSAHNGLTSDLRDLSERKALERVHGDRELGEDIDVVKFEDLHVHSDDDTMAKKLATQVPVLVWVMTSPQNLDKKAVHVRNTWGKRANTVLFMSSRWNSSFPTIGLNVSEGREHLTAKTLQAFRYIYEHHFDDADWFMKADDDTYVIMENLRYLLSSYSSQAPIFLGHAFKVIVKQGFASGGAGYVISKEALRRLATTGLHNASICRQDGGAEDAELGKCFMALGVKLVSSLDSLGRSRFHCFRPETHAKGDYANWYTVYDANGAKKGIANMSDYAVTFHYIGPSKMYELEYFIYHLRPYGLLSRPQSLNRGKGSTGNHT